MNLKKAKRLRRVARVAMSQVPGASLESSEYERHVARGNVRVAVTSPRSLYHRLKKELP